MFNLFKRSKVEEWEKQVLINIFCAMPPEFNYLKEQIQDGLLKRVSFGSTVRPNFVGFSYDGSVSKKYERKSDTGFVIKGVKVFDNLSQSYIDFEIIVYYGLVIGYSTPNNKNVKLDIHRIDTSKLRVQYNTNQLYEKIKPLLRSDYLRKVSPDNVYEVELDGKMYYHLQDLEDGDFIGMDESGKYYEITHDPYEIKEIS
ncbi:hypothetical protein SAMN05660909_04583 [Chitinophaga terrae (ex Kim and Jung 2007)]|uniref:Uncharacterized protein n=1 Tax=Chitinophaga terrae (ex Kim and Jung 2007) TaxID=408074 RepID=A0A1H4FPL4_9BACT|nr:hypothetical protein [Chitinophaga terrae (ex Kim and Jung 2007)]SEA99225.1 hypothetical protein SAMN05660909_04583 [Chitinophaga terrae (ex Kim and Jung 2007)]